MLYLYNSLTKKKELFQSMEPGKVGLYVCGMTVYDQCHLGHARSMLCFDVIVRFLRALNYQVFYVRNITDVDDKIIHRAAERGVSINDLTRHYIEVMREESRRLGLISPDLEPKATEHIDDMIAMIEALIQKGFAYLTANGDLCYQVSSFHSYGKLSQQNTAELLSGVRIEVDADKRSPLDFVLWKRAKADEPSWPSPWGLGRPGWHIECSAMSLKALGAQFDIHGGGMDLQFPHHENEIAQSEALSNKPLANYWMHSGLLQINHEKMAKSTGNFLSIADVLDKQQPEVLRYFLISSHYRSKLNYSEANIADASRALGRLYRSLKENVVMDEDIDLGFKEAFFSAMNDDFNTPEALAVLFQLSHELNKNRSHRLAVTLKYLGGILGLLQEDPAIFLKTSFEKIDAKAVDALLAARQDARASGDWAKADLIRNELNDLGLEIEDGATGSTWRFKTVQ